MVIGVNAHGFFESGGSGNLWCIFSIFPVTLFFLPLSVFLPTMHRFTCKLLSVVCGECTKFKHINKHFNFQIASSLYSWAHSNSLSSHSVLPNSQNLSLTVRETVRERLGRAGLGLPLAAFERCCGWFSPFPGCRWLLAPSVGASRAKALCSDKLPVALEEERERTNKKKKCFKRKHFFSSLSGEKTGCLRRVFGNAEQRKCWLFVAFLQGQSDERRCIRTVMCTGTSGWNVGGLILPALLVSDVQSNTCVNPGPQKRLKGAHNELKQVVMQCLEPFFPCCPIK
ncbi:hypothetical protein EK904_008743, partial [Melospiza melodia maxima]